MSPNPAGYLFERAVVTLRAGKREEAIDLLTEVIRYDRRHADAWSLRGRLESDAGRPFNAMLHHEIAVQAAPDRQDLWCNRGIDAAAAKMFDISKASFERSLAIEETFEGHYNFANLCSALMDVDGAVAHYRRAREIMPVNAQLHANFGIALMAQGHWREGFQNYRHRFNAPGFPPRPRFDYPIWHGESLEGKTILLYVEQGFGDEIQSLRFAKPIKEMGARVIVSTRPMIYRLARSLPFADAVILQYDEPPWKPDYMCALLDVPAWVDMGPDSVPLAGGYLKSEGRGYSLGWPSGMKVGICWQSGIRHLQPSVFEIARQKSLTFEKLAPLARGGVTLVSLQKENNCPDELRRAGVIDPMAGVQDFADTAWIIDQLDLIVTVDTAVAHLAGALGKPVWNLVRFDGLWPWMRATHRTCWYDSMTIYRQPAPFDWTEPLGRLMADFGTLLTERCVAA